MKSESDRRIIGRCLCGGIKFSAESPPLFVAHCHCRYCRLAHGAAFVTWLGAKDSDFSIDEGDDILTWFSASEFSKRGFCSVCGSTLFFVSDLSPGEFHIARANVTSEVKERPFAQLFVEHQVDWLTLQDGLPTHTGQEIGLNKYDVVKPLA